MGIVNNITSRLFAIFVKHKPIVSFLLLITVNIAIISLYDLLVPTKILQIYEIPPFASSLYNPDTGKFFELSHLAELIIITSIIMLLIVPSSKHIIKLMFPSLFIIMLFTLYDLEVQAHVKIPTLSTLSFVITFKEFLGYKALFVALLTGIIFIFAAYLLIEGFYISMKNIVIRQNNGRVKLGFFLILILKILAFWGIAFSLVQLANKYHQYIWWHPKMEVWAHGRIMSFYKHSVRERESLRNLSAFVYNLSSPPHKVLFSDSLIHTPNIYFILLESHLDISRLKKFKFSKFPIHPELIKFMPDSSFSLIRSPVIGGFTSQATFEMITGVPALQLFSPVEFSVFGKHKTYSLLLRLKEQGYHTYAFIAASNIYYNMQMGYRDLGFDTSFFMGLISPYKENFPEKYVAIPDDTIYAFVLRQLNRIPEPKFIYIVTMYGHWEWVMPSDTDTITIFPYKKPFPALVNVMYRKQKFLGQLIDTLLKLDSNSLIVAFTDHNPPFVFSDTSKVKYDAPSIYHVPILILYKGKKINIPIVPMHRVPELIYHLIAHDTLPDTTALVSLEIKKYLYKQIIKQSRQKL